MRRFEICTVLIIIFSSCEDRPSRVADDAHSDSITHRPQAVVVARDKQEDQREISMDDIETAERIIDLGLDISKKATKAIRLRDSLRAADREKFFAYQLGFVFSSRKKLLEAFEKLNDPTYVFALEKDRREYYLIRFDGKSEEELKEELEAFNAGLPAEIPGKAKIINLSMLCGKREQLFNGDDIERKRSETKLPCLICK